MPCAVKYSLSAVLGTQQVVDRLYWSEGLERNLDEQLERAATRTFRDSFLIGAALAVAALLTVIAPRRRRTS